MTVEKVLSQIIDQRRLERSGKSLKVVRMGKHQTSGADLPELAQYKILMQIRTIDWYSMRKVMQLHLHFLMQLCSSPLVLMISLPSQGCQNLHSTGLPCIACTSSLHQSDPVRSGATNILIANDGTYQNVKVVSRSGSLAGFQILESCRGA